MKYQGPRDNIAIGGPPPRNWRDVDGDLRQMRAEVEELREQVRTLLDANAAKVAP